MNIFLLGFLLLLCSCVGKNTGPFGISDNNLQPCSKENICLSSSTSLKNKKDYIEPIKFYEKKSIAYKKLIKILSNYSVQFIAKNPNYIHARFDSSLLAPQRDAEFYFLPNNKVINLKISRGAGWPGFSSSRTLLEEIKFKFFQHDTN